ncbi:hypothetical protein RhiTH_006278 [Rhizoctonia solani]
MSATYLPPVMYQKLFERDDPTPLRPKSVRFPELTPQISSLKLAGKRAPEQVLTTLHLLNDDIKAAHDIAEPCYDQVQTVVGSLARKELCEECERESIHE